MTDQENPDGFTAEEQAAMEAMEQDTAPVTAGEQQEAAEAKAAERAAAEAEAAGTPQEAQTTPEAPQEAPQEPQGEFKSVRGETLVPHQALHSERVRRQDAEAKLAELTAKVEALEKAAQPAEVTPEWADPLENPEKNKAWSEWNAENKAQQAAEKAVAEIRKEQAQQQEQAARVRRAEAAEQEFMAKTPDYLQATKFLQQARGQELQTQGYSPEQIVDIMRTDANNLFDAAEKIGMNIAEMVYLQAQKRGYEKAATPDPVTPDPVTPSPEQKIEHLAEAQAKVKGLGSAGGPAQQGKLTIKQLADMSDADFDKLSDAELQAAMGG